MAEAVSFSGGKDLVKLPIPEDAFGKVHTFAVALKNGDIPNARVTIFSDEKGEEIAAHIHPGHTQRLTVGKHLFARADKASALTVEPATA